MTGGYPPLDSGNGEANMGNSQHGRRAEDSEEFSRITNFDLYQMIQELNTKTDKHITAQAEMMPKLKELVLILDRGKFLVAVFMFMGLALGGLWAAVVWAKDHLKF